MVALLDTERGPSDTRHRPPSGDGRAQAMSPKDQGFSLLGVLLGVCAILLTFGTAWLLDLNRGATFFALIGWGLALFVGAAWLRGERR